MRQGSIGDQAQHAINFYMDKHNWNGENLNEDNQGNWDFIILDFIKALSSQLTYYKDRVK